MKDQKINTPFPFSADGKPSVLLFFVSVALMIALTCSMWAINLVGTYLLRIFCVLLVIILYTSVAVIAMKLTGQTHVLRPVKRNLWLQALIGLGLAATLCFFFGILPILFDTSLVGSHMEPDAGRLVILAVEDLFFVGIGEEVFFRGYVQNQFEIWLGRRKIFAPLIAGILFGLWHLINGSLLQMLIASVIGCVFGYARAYVKDCTLLSVIIAHGFYDFSLTLLACFVL